ncbi:hypothetical protein HDV03_004271 [Kappamyces sp. JEL0829]|nr:hypothetical protein HDV03_004271 [Kappamyces sp. JEL0829]
MDKLHKGWDWKRNSWDFLGLSTPIKDWKQVIADKHLFGLVLDGLLSKIEEKKCSGADQRPDVPANPSSAPADSSRKSRPSTAESLKKDLGKTVHASEQSELWEKKYYDLLAIHRKTQEKNKELEDELAKTQERAVLLEDLFKDVTGDEHIMHLAAQSPQKGKAKLIGEALSNKKAVLLKSLIAQLKRQVAVLKDEQRNKEVFVYSAKEQVDLAEQLLRSAVDAPASKKAEAKKELPKTKEPGRGIETRVVQDCVKRLRALSKYMTRGEKDRLTSSAGVKDAAYLFDAGFLDGHRKQLATVADFASGKIDHLNLAQVSRLESQLSTLYASLLALESCLSTSLEPHLPLFADHIASRFEETMNQVLLAANSLLSLSLLVPAPPLVPLEKALELGGTLPSSMDDIFKALSLTDRERQKLQGVLAPILRSTSDSRMRLEQECRVLNEELEVHRAQYSRYTQTLLHKEQQWKHHQAVVRTRLDKQAGALADFKRRLDCLEWKEEAVEVLLSDLEPLLATTVEAMSLDEVPPNA